MSPKLHRSTPGSPSTDQGEHGGVHNAQDCLDHLFHEFATTPTSRGVFGASVDVLESMDRKTVAILQRLRALQNASKPAACLPQEILTIVFTFVAHATTSEAPVSCVRTPKFQRGWMCVRRVCRSWRQAADASAGLWTKIFVAPVAGQDVRRLAECEIADRELATTRLFLKNSRMAKLDVCLELDQSPQHEAILSETLGQLHRIRDLQLLREGPSMTESTQLMLNTPAPCLETLVIDVPLKAVPFTDEDDEEAHANSDDHRELDDTGNESDNDRSEDDTDEDDSEDEGGPDSAEATYFVLPTIFNGHTPALRSLTLRKCISSSSAQFGSLVRLHLFNLDFKNLPTLQPLADFLDGMPLLEDLMFTDVNAGRTPQVVYRPASLPSLKTLHLVGGASTPLSYTAISRVFRHPAGLDAIRYEGKYRETESDWPVIGTDDLSNVRVSYGECFGELEFRYGGSAAPCWVSAIGFDP